MPLVARVLFLFAIDEPWLGFELGGLFKRFEVQ